jgi:signal transduction histidine kinase
MEAIANLAAGIAHQFNNALLGIAGNLELLKMDLPADGNLDRYIKPMEASIGRMTHLTSQLLAYARGGRYQPETLSLSYFVREWLPSIRDNVDPAIGLETDLVDDIFTIEADPVQMQMVLSAVVANASEAIEGAGQIRIITRNTWIEGESARDCPGLKPGPYACLIIEDNGCGMDEKTKTNVFDPFFTTKFQGRGLGMAAVYGIVKSHDGGVFLDTVLGRGTVIRIYLPASGVRSKRAGEQGMGMFDRAGDMVVVEEEGVVMGG